DVLGARDDGGGGGEAVGGDGEGEAEPAHGGGDGDDEGGHAEGDEGADEGAGPMPEGGDELPHDRLRRSCPRSRSCWVRTSGSLDDDHPTRWPPCNSNTRSA